MKAFIKYFVLLAVCTNALAMYNEYRCISDIEYLLFDENRVDLGASTSGDCAAAPLTEPELADELRRTGFKEAPPGAILPPYPPSPNSSFQSKRIHYFDGIDYSEASASSSSAAAPAPAAIEASAIAIKARYERATNRKKAIIESLICPFRDCQFKLQGTAAEIGVIPF